MNTMSPHSIRSERGIVLPMALIMLVILSFAGLMAARNSATHEQFTNNMRTNNVARQAAEAALRYCEQVAIDKVDDEVDKYSADVAKIVTTELANFEPTTVQAATWNTKANWKSGAGNLIEVTLSQDSTVQENAEIKNKPQCIIQPAADDRFLVTARGLSNDAVVSTTDGTLESGSEVWLQSILAPGRPTLSASFGPQY